MFISATDIPPRRGWGSMWASMFYRHVAPPGLVDSGGQPVLQTCGTYGAEQAP